MNPDEFEQALMRDLASVPRHDPTPAWKADILAHALAPAKGNVVTFPRLVLLAWAACWMAALVLHFMTPSSAPDLMAGVTSRPVPAEEEWRALENRRETMSALLAANDSNNPVHP